MKTRKPRLQVKPASDQSGGPYLTAREAALLLEISVPTLYTYVSRKNIQPHKVPGQRSSRYLRSDIEQIKQGISPAARREATPGLTTSSAITLATEVGSYYRGKSAIELAERASLEEVARLLWDAEGDDPFEKQQMVLPAQWDGLFAATKGYNWLDQVSMLLPALEAANPRAHDLSKAGFLRSGADVLRWSAALLLNQSRPADGPIHRYIAARTRCGARLEDAVRRVLVLAADQALEPATYAVRATANTGATPYRCVLSGLAAATGNRQPSVRVVSFSRFIDEIESAPDPSEPVKFRVREGQGIPGFGFSPFPTRDPRADALWFALKDVLEKDKGFVRFDRALQMAVELTGQRPDFSLLAAYVNKRIGGRPHASLIRLGRFVGWIAHALEQQTDKPLLRWRVNYTGPSPADVGN